MKIFRRFPRVGVMTGASLILAACGGGQTYYERLDSRGQSLAEAADALFLTEGFSDPSALPELGEATYDGVVGVATETLIVQGELELVANFLGDSISGSAQNFVDNQNTIYDGVINLSNGAIDRTADTSVEFTFSADADGTLSDSSDDYLVDAFLEGDFVGDSQDFVAGYVEGTVTSSVGTEDLIGVFIGEQR